MPNVRILYVPWPEIEAGELAHQARRFLVCARKAPIKAGKTAKHWQFFFFDGTKPDYLSALERTDQIYVLGHGLPGKTVVWAEVGKSLPRAKYEEVCERLKLNGLKEDFQGKIKFYSCWGAAVNDKGEVGAISFAGQAAKLLREMGFKKCQIFGYKRDLSSPDEDEGKKQYGMIYPNEGRHFWVPGPKGPGTSAVRAPGPSAVRVEYDENGTAKSPPVVPRANTSSASEFVDPDDPG